MIRITTILELRENKHSLGLYCMACDRWGMADLDHLVDAGRGGTVVTDARFRCRDCGSVVEKQVRPPMPMLGDTTRYIGFAARS